MKPRVFYGRFVFTGDPAAWCVAHRGRIVASDITWPAAIELALSLAA